MRAVVLSVLVASAVPVVAQTQAALTLEGQNKAFVRKCLETLADAQTASLAHKTCFAEQVTFRGRTASRDSLLENLYDSRTTFPDWRDEILEMVAEGDVVVVRLRASGTHKGVSKRAINGGMLVGVPPTGKRFEIEFIRWYRIRDGKIVEQYIVRDDIGMMRQLGVVPPAPTSK
jgi:predicted ester cyclase